jgi:glycosyltransferase involved in cell wall biosynthesis
LISIIIPTYNSLGLLKKTISSLEAQQFGLDAIEVIVINDGSTDETDSWLQEYSQSTPLNFLWRTIPNAGPGNARNVGVSLAKHSWIGLLDSDIVVDSSWVKHALQLIESQPDVGAFEGRVEISDREQVTLFTHQTESHGERYVTCNLLVRKNLVHFHTDYRAAFREDSDLAFQILSQGYSIHYAPELLVWHPPLAAHWTRPLKLAQRYFYDGLLARRFPEYYKNQVDHHYIFGVKIPHLKRWLMLYFLISQIVLFTSLMFSFPMVGLFLYLGGISSAFVPAIHHVPAKNWTWRDLKPYLVVVHLIPWVMNYHLLKGFWAFRKTLSFQEASSNK